MKQFTAILIGVSLIITLTGVYAISAEKGDCADEDAKCWIDVLKKGNGAPALRAAMALGKLKSSEAVPALIDKFKSDDPYMATAAVHALTSIGEPAVPALEEAAESRHSSVRRYTAYTLGNIGGGAALKTISKLTRDKEAEVRKNAAIALGKIQDKSSLFDLVNLLQDRYRPVRLEALKSLATMPDERVVDSVVDYSLSDLDSEVAMEAAGVLIKIGPPVVPSLLKDVQNRAPNVKMKICAILGEIGPRCDPAVKSQIEKILVFIAKNKNDVLDVRQAACVGLGTVGGKNAEAALQEVIADYQGKIAAAALVESARKALQQVQSRKTLK